MDLARDHGIDEREFWVRDGWQNHAFHVTRRGPERFYLRYPNNVFEVGGKGLLADRLGEFLADGQVFSLVIEDAPLPAPIAQAQRFVERRVAACG